MATQIKLEVILTIPDDDVRVEADRLAMYMREYVPSSASRNDRAPHYDRLEIAVKRTTWEKVNG